MNPLFERKLFIVRYVVLYAAFAAAYSIIFGIQAGLPPGYIAVDWIFFTIVSGLGGVVLWSVLKYGKGPAGSKAAAYYLAAGVLFVGAAIGAESAAMAMMPGGMPRGFAGTLPARSLVLALAYAWFALYYAYAGRYADGEVKKEEPPKPLKPNPGAVERITIRGGQKIKVIAVGEIIYIQAEGDYAAIVTAEGRFLKELTMKYFEENLPPGSFVRVHRSCIVAVSRISRIEQSGREYAVVLCDGTRVRISDGGYKQLRAVLGL